MDKNFINFVFCTRTIKLTLIIIFLGTISSCKKEVNENQIQDVSFSSSIYHPRFLFIGERNDTVSKRLKFHFNNWAIQQKSKIQLGFYDNNGNIIDHRNGSLKLIVNGSTNTSGLINLNSQTRSQGDIKISVIFAPNTQTTTYSGFLKIINSDLDRVNSVSNLNKSPILSWSATQQVVWNPLKKYLIIGLIVLLTMLVIWLLILSPIVYPRFGRGSLTIQSPFFKSLKLNDSIGLTLCDHSIKQPWKEKFFQGKQLTYANPVFLMPIKLTPHSKNKIRIQLDSVYSIHPFTTNLEKGKGEYIITNLKTKEKISLTYG